MWPLVEEAEFCLSLVQYFPQIYSVPCQIISRVPPFPRKPKFLTEIIIVF